MKDHKIWIESGTDWTQKENVKAEDVYEAALAASQQHGTTKIRIKPCGRNCKTRIIDTTELTGDF